MKSDIPKCKKFLSCLWFPRIVGKRGNSIWMLGVAPVFSSPSCRNSSSHSQVSCQNTQARGSIIINLPTGAPINVSLKQPIFLYQFPPLWYTGHVSKKSEAIHILSYITKSHVEMSLHYQDSHVKKNRLIVNVSNLTMLMEPLDILSPHLFLRCLSRRQLQESFQALGSSVYVY